VATANVDYLNINDIDQAKTCNVNVVYPEVNNLTINSLNCIVVTFTFFYNDKLELNHFIFVIVIIYPKQKKKHFFKKKLIQFVLPHKSLDLILFSIHSKCRFVRISG
jgi:hypothetical protein